MCVVTQQAKRSNAIGPFCRLLGERRGLQQIPRSMLGTLNIVLRETGKHAGPDQHANAHELEKPFHGQLASWPESLLRCDPLASMPCP